MPYLGFKLQCREHQQPSPTAHGVHQTPPFFSASQGNCINLDTPREPFQLISTHLPKTDAERRAAVTKQPQSLTPTLLLTAFIHPVPSRGSSSLLNHRAEGFIPILDSKHEADRSRSSNSRAQHLHQPHPPYLSSHPCQELQSRFLYYQPPTAEIQQCLFRTAFSRCIPSKAFPNQQQQP